MAAEHGLHTLLAGRLAAVLAAGVKAAFIPDMSSQHLEQAKTVLVSLRGRGAAGTRLQH